MKSCIVAVFSILVQLHLFSYVFCMISLKPSVCVVQHVSFLFCNITTVLVHSQRCDLCIIHLRDLCIIVLSLRSMFALWWSMPVVAISWCTFTMTYSQSLELCSMQAVWSWVYSTCMKTRLSTGKSVSACTLHLMYHYVYISDMCTNAGNLGIGTSLVL